MLLSPVWDTRDKALFHGLGFPDICICRSFIFLRPSPISKHNSFLEIQYFLFGKGDFYVLLRSPSSALFFFHYLASWNKVMSLSGFTHLTQPLDVYQCIHPLAWSVSMYIAFVRFPFIMVHMGTWKEKEKIPYSSLVHPSALRQRASSETEKSNLVLPGGLIISNSNTYLKVIVLNML